MTKRILCQAVAVIFAIAVLIQVGCAGRSEPPNYYVLRPAAGTVSELESNAGSSMDIAIGISPVSLPKYLKKQKIVSRTGSNGLLLAENDRWAGRLEEDIGRVIAENLSHLLGTDRVLAYPAIDIDALDYTVKVDISRFEGKLGGDIELIARWALFDSRGNRLYGVKATHIIEAIRGQGYPDMVAAQSRALAVFSAELAQTLKELAVR